MAKLARCPSCGATVEFKSVASVLAVCDYCQSTLVRNGEEIENLGKMAALIEDRSPLQRGAEGSWQGVHFGLIGRIQLKYEQGLWNEWHLLFDNGKSGWLSEAGGEYVMSVPLRVTEPLPAFAEVAIDQRYVVAGRSFTVTNILQAECVAGEGELPFKVGGGYPAPVVDLRDEKGGFATFDYSDSEDGGRPLVFVGDSVDFASLRWANLRDRSALPEVTIEARAFACPSCGAPLTVKHENIESVGCGSCGAVLDTSHDTVALLAQAKVVLNQSPQLPLGSKGTLRGEAVEVIGYMRRCMTADGVEYCWSEYVCLGKDNALLWLTEYDGHWNLARVANRAVRAIGDVRYDNEDFRHFQSYQARVKFVIGEFPWRVALDETATVDDYVAPPRMLSHERTQSEGTWTVAEYLGADEIAAAFSLKQALPAARGIFANQPNPHQERQRALWRLFGLLAAVGLGLHLLLLVAGPGGSLLKHRLTFNPSADEPALTPEFRLFGNVPRLEVANATDANNNWVALGLTLANQDTGQIWQANREISRYAGVDGGESWTEGSASDEVYFADLPPGNYVLAVEHEMDTGARPIGSTLTVSRPGPRLSSLALLLLALLPFPLLARGLHTRFEVKRWAESDHPIVTSDDDSDD